MTRYLFISIAFHVFLVLALTMGFFNWPQKDMDMLQPVAIEVVDYAEKAQSPNPTPDSLKLEEPEKDIPEPQPAPTPEQPAEEVKPEPTPEPTPAPEPEPEPEAIPEPKKEEIKKPEPKKEEKKEPEKPKDKPKDKPKEKPKKKEPEDVMSILKNLQSQSKASGNSKSGPITATPGQGGELGDKVTASEMDRVRKQIEGAWKIPAGSQGINKIKVPVKIIVNPDRTVASAKLVEPHRMGDIAYRTLAESALHAVLTFKNRPLLLPPEKYQVWKEITIYFDPTNIL